MKSSFLGVLILLFAVVCFGQQRSLIHNLPHPQNKKAVRDTTIESDTTKENKEPRYFYITTGVNVFVNTIGGFAKRFSPSIELGRTYGIFDIGLAMGRLNTLSASRDSSKFIELRPTVNIFSKGRFSEGLCLGGGYVFGAKQGFMTEICNSINFNITEIFQISVVQGYYFFDGTMSNRNTQFMGLNLTYNLLKPHSVNKQRKRVAILNDN
jgi:hypothetical protein